MIFCRCERSSAKLGRRLGQPKGFENRDQANLCFQVMPPAVDNDELVTTLKRYLDRTRKLRGLQIATSMCMLAVEKDGAYPPLNARCEHRE